MDQKFKELSVFFPFYNEEKNIRPQTEAALKIIPQFAKKYEIILVNDGSADRTGEIAEKLAKEHPQVRVVNHRHNRGYGGALKSGFKASRYSWIFFTDGDRQFDLRQLKKLITKTDQADIIIGYRKKRADPLIRLLNAKLFNLLIRLLFGLKVRDIDCAFKLIKKEVLRKITLKSNGALISSELLIKAQKQKFKIKEVPVDHLPRRAGQPTGADPKVIFKAFYDLFRLFRELRKD